MAVFWEDQQAFDVMVVLARHYRSNLRGEEKLITLRFKIS